MLYPVELWGHGTHVQRVGACRPAEWGKLVFSSIRSDFDPPIHLQASRALSALRCEGVLIPGSGVSYHNLRRFDVSAGEPTHQIEGWLRRTMQDLSPEARVKVLLEWEQAPSARIATPMQDHLIPLMGCFPLFRLKSTL